MFNLFKLLFPFPIMLWAYPSDLARTKNWGTETLTDADLEGQLDLIINWLMAFANATTGHKHDATANEGPKITSAGLAAASVLFAAFNAAGAYGLFTGDWSFNEIALVEDTAPATAANEGKLYTKDSGGQPELFFREESNGDEVQITKGGKIASNIVQVVNIQTGTLATGTTIIPHDNTKPQNTEGDEYMTLVITPTSATNKLKIDIVFQYNIGGNDRVTVALFQDTIADALAVGQSMADTNEENIIHFVYFMVAGTTSATTFKIRAGGSAGSTLAFNGGDNGGAVYNGLKLSSITITEIAA